MNKMILFGIACIDSAAFGAAILLGSTTLNAVRWVGVVTLLMMGVASIAIARAEGRSAALLPPEE